MKKVTVFLLVFFMLFSASSLFARGAQDGVRNLRMACNHPVGHPVYAGNRAFVEYVYRATNGRINIEYFHSEQLGGESQTVELTQLGEIAFNRLGVAFLAGVNPQIGAFSMPFLYRDSAHMWRVLESPLGDEALQMLVPQGLLGLAWYDAGARHFYTTGRPIRTID
ncbi:MAG: TRAP transporter substrate-binding protein DctP, partial [Treponema sp.]|nr:TRAP transporter substrate-binding protein DctP [Treponema sp.]